MFCNPAFELEGGGEERVEGIRTSFSTPEPVKPPAAGESNCQHLGIRPFQTHVYEPIKSTQAVIYPCMEATTDFYICQTVGFFSLKMLSKFLQHFWDWAFVTFLTNESDNLVCSQCFLHKSEFGTVFHRVLYLSHFSFYDLKHVSKYNINDETKLTEMSSQDMIFFNSLPCFYLFILNLS